MKYKYSRKQGLPYKPCTARGNRRSGSDATIVADKGFFWKKPEPVGKLNTRRAVGRPGIELKQKRIRRICWAVTPADWGLKDACVANNETRELSAREKRQQRKEKRCY